MRLYGVISAKFVRFLSHPLFHSSGIYTKYFSPQESPYSLRITLDGEERPYPAAVWHIGNCFQLEIRRTTFTSSKKYAYHQSMAASDAAVGWIAHSSYLGAIPKGNRIRGIRARLGNIQVGDERVFDHLFEEERFNRWCVGEVHILDSRIMYQTEDGTTSSGTLT